MKHLKASQLVYQVLFRVRAKASFEKPKGGNVTGGYCAWSEQLELDLPSGKSGCLDVQSWTFRFVGLEHCFNGRIDWSGGPHGKLWNYNLHYFEWIWGLSQAEAKECVLDWIARHPFTQTAEGWEPYPLSMRMMNWLGYWGTVGRNLFDQDSEFRVRLVESICMQGDWLTKRLEKHLLGNHYLENGAALWIAGAFFEDSAVLQNGETTQPQGGTPPLEAGGELKGANIPAPFGKWKQLGQSILEEQFREQILEDGMHFELSPMYLNRVRYLLSWLAAIEGDREGSRWESWLESVTTAALQLRHPDGRIALFNDSAFEIYPETEGDPPMGVFALKAGGYYGARTNQGDYVVCDAGRVGPDYIPGHAHCDIGSFELSIYGKRFITDTGVYHYENTEKRHYSRSTRAHNTFGPDGQEPAEIWGAFRVGRRPVVDVTEWKPEGTASLSLRLRHNGFSKAEYSRHFEFSDAGWLVIEDQFSGAKDLAWTGRLHFAPGVEMVEPYDGATLRLRHCCRTISLSVEGVDKLVQSESPYYPLFNEETKRLSIIYQVNASIGSVRVKLNWAKSP